MLSRGSTFQNLKRLRRDSSGVFLFADGILAVCYKNFTRYDSRAEDAKGAEGAKEKKGMSCCSPEYR